MQRTVVAMAMVTALGGCAWFGSGSAPKPMDLGPNVVNLPVRQAWTVRIPAIKDANVRAQVQGQDVIVAAADGTVVSINASNGVKAGVARPARPCKPASAPMAAMRPW